MLEVTRSQHEQLLRAWQCIVDSELPRGRHGRIEPGRGQVHRLPDVPGRDGGIVIRQGFEDVSMLPGEFLDRWPGAGGGKLQPQRLMTEGWHVEMTAFDARLPGQCQRPNSAAEADAHVADPHLELAIEL